MPSGIVWIVGGSCAQGGDSDGHDRNQVRPGPARRGGGGGSSSTGRAPMTHVTSADAAHGRPVTPPAGPPSERLAARLVARETAPPALLDELTRLDVATYRAIAGTSTPTFDEPLRRLSDVASHSKLWIGIAALMAAFGGRSGRRTALTGLTAVAVNSLVVNVPLKQLGRRARPDRAAARVAPGRQVRMPTSPSFPSGHAASAFAFVAAVARTTPGLARPLRALAYLVGYSRVHTGVHYPGDVIVGAFIGTAIGESVAYAANRPRRGGP
jgi:undecaprenyl-diphosphatase